MKKQPQQNSPFPRLDYHTLFLQLPAQYMIVRADDPAYTFVDASDAYLEMTGVPRKRLGDRPLFDIFPDVSEKYKRTGVSDLQEVLRTVIRTKAKIEMETFRYDIADSNGDFIEKYWQPTYYPLLDTKGSVEFIVSYSKDVTDELRKARELRELQEQLEEALGIGQVGSWLWEVEEGVVVTNKTLAQILGIDTEQALIGIPVQRFIDAIHFEDRQRVLREINASISDGVNFESEYRIVSSTGVTHWVLARGRLKINETGHVASFPGVIMDITERHNFEEQIENARLREELNKGEAELLQKRNEELEALSRTKDEFVALASHQLRTPATAVKQYVGMVLQGYVGEVTPTQADMLERAFLSNERQIQIINQILNAARVDTGRLVMSCAPLDVRAQLIGIVEEMRPSIEAKGHALEASLKGKSVTVWADAAYLRMAIENVIHNASIYTPVPGKIGISLKVASKHAEIAVSDNGVGIKKTDIGKLFTKFSRIHNPLSVQAGGSGIGLYLTAEILRLHGGTIAVESKIHKGTTFTIRLPLLEKSKSD